jgi:hypothetical protein
MWSLVPVRPRTRSILMALCCRTASTVSRGNVRHVPFDKTAEDAETAFQVHMTDSIMAPLSRPSVTGPPAPWALPHYTFRGNVRSTYTGRVGYHRYETRPAWKNGKLVMERKKVTDWVPLSSPEPVVCPFDSSKDPD